MRKTLLLMLAAVTLAASLPADAHGGRSHSRVRVGVMIGAPVVFAPWWSAHSHPYPYYHPAPPVVMRERVIVREPLVFYDEHGNPVPPARVQGAPQSGTAPTWHYCPDSQAYYPYVQTCASAWQRVMPHPPPQ
ncbi:MAG: hypothetical protein KF834_08085 [Burkholderiales bacterium]|nr:hypothetical protein [Burkholderiales bacterium]